MQRREGAQTVRTFIRITFLIGLAAARTAAQSVPSQKADKAAPSKETTARVVGIERATITLPGHTVKDYAACMKSAADLPDFQGKKAVQEEMKKDCEKLDELHKRQGISPGYYPPTKGQGYMITFETSTATYIVSTVGRCEEVLANGQCGGEWVPNVMVGRTYLFHPSCIGETDMCLADTPVKEDAVPEVRVIGHLESVVEKKRAE